MRPSNNLENKTPSHTYWDMFMNIRHPYCQLKISKNDFLGITSEKLHIFDNIHIMCILVLQNGWYRENVIFSKFFPEND